MRSKIRLSLVLSLVFHVILVLGLFSGAGRHGREAEALVVELVSFAETESASALVGDAAGASDLIPPRPAFPMQSEETPASIEEAAPPPPESSSVKEDEEEISSLPAQEEPKAALPEEPAPSSDPILPVDGTEESPSEGQPEPEPAFRLVAEAGRFEEGSSGSGTGEGGGGGHGSAGGGAPQPTVGDALPGGIGIGGAGGGKIAPRFVIPRAGRANPKPRYPEGARAEGREGTALLRVTVLPTGKVGEALVERSSGHADLDRSAVEAVMKWTFLPARRGENPVTSSVRIPVTFALDRP